MPLVGTRRSHYETAFEACLSARGTPFVAVEDVRPSLRGRLGIKTFDYIAYPADGVGWLLDVKGRKSVPGRSGGADWRQKTWVTRADVEGLAQWQAVFGGGFHAAFLFAYWHSGYQPELWMDSPAADARRGVDVVLAGRAYSFWLIRLDDYARHQRRLSPRWDTVSLSREDFRNLAMPLDRCWPAAPC